MVIPASRAANATASWAVISAAARETEPRGSSVDDTIASSPSAVATVLIVLPNTSTQAVWTNVIVHDGDTLVLGGLVSDQTTKGKQKVPYLADIPVLGFLFRGKSNQIKQSSLLIFVTPTIIDTTGARFFEAGTGLSVQQASAGASTTPSGASFADMFEVAPAASAGAP